MDESRGQKGLFLGHSFLALLVAILVFAGVWLVGYALFSIWDLARGLSQDWLQSVFRELLPPAVAGYVSMRSVPKVFNYYNARLVFFGFATVIASLLVGYMTMVVPISREI